MPRGDRTGPSGQGSMTGRGAGFCTGANVPGYANNGMGRGGMGFGRGAGAGLRNGNGRGFQNRFFAQSRPNFGGFGQNYGPVQNEFTADQEMKMLMQEAKYIQDELSSINNRIKELENISEPKD